MTKTAIIYSVAKNLRRLGCFTLLLILLFSLIVCLHPANTLAIANFHTKLTTTYTVQENGQTWVEHHFEIKNLTPELFINKYGLKLTSEAIDQVQVIHNGKTLQPEIVKSKQLTSIGITFEDRIVGEGKVNDFIIRYLHPEIVQVNGQVLEINIPQIKDPEQYDEHLIRIVTPARFGKPTKVNQTDYQVASNAQTVTTVFSNNQGDSIFAIFGKNQFFHLSLHYHLKNPTSNLGITQITLPPDTQWQTINYNNLEPKPEKIEIDADGNWIATYQLPANAELTIIADATVKINLAPNLDLPPTIPNQAHVQKQKYWELDDPTLIKAAQDNSQVDQIYHYTIDQLDYTTADLNQELERLGATAALSKPDQATCQEFTDLFIALSRINQIPARRATGFAYSQNEKLRPLSLKTDILHAWPEYYDQQQQLWVPVDPTWGDTTGGVDYFHQFDLNHIVFAYNGVDSRLPFPAGSYKIDAQQSKDVEVEFADKFPEIKPEINLSVNPNKTILFSLPGMYNITLINQTGKAWYNLNLNITNDQQISVKTSQDLSKIDLLPFQTKNIPITIYNSTNYLPQASQLGLELKIANYESIKQNLDAYSAPKIHDTIYNPIFIAGLGLSIIIFTLITGSILVFRHKK